MSYMNSNVKNPHDQLYHPQEKSQQGGSYECEAGLVGYFSHLFNFSNSSDLFYVLRDIPVTFTEAMNENLNHNITM